MSKKWKIPYLNLVPIIIITICLYKIISSTDVSMSGILNVLYSCTAYFIWGFVFAYFLNPAMVFFEKLIESKKDKKYARLMKRGTIISLIYIIAIGLIVLFFVAVMPTITAGIKDFIDNIPKYANNMEIWITDITNSIDPSLSANVDDFIKDIMDFVYRWMTGLMDLSSIGGSVIAAVSGSAIALARVVFGIVVSVYFLFSKEEIIKQIKALTYSVFSTEKANKIVGTSREINRIFLNFIVSKLLQSLILSVIGMFILIPLKIPLAPLIAIVIGITNMIPYFGPYIGAIPSVLVVLFYDPIKALWVVIFAVAIQIIDNLFVGPKIMSDQVGISPLLVIAGVTVCGTFGGILGMFIGVPLAAILKLVFYDKFIAGKLSAKNIDIDKL